MANKKRREINDKDFNMVLEYYRNGFNKVEAARYVGYKDPETNAWRQFDRPEVKKFIQLMRSRLLDTFDVVDAEWLKRCIKLLATANITQIAAKLQENDWNLNVLSAEEQYAIKDLVITEKYDKEGNYLGRTIKITGESKTPNIVNMLKILGEFEDTVNHKLGGELMKRLDAARKRVGKARPDLKQLEVDKNKPLRDQVLDSDVLQPKYEDIEVVEVGE